MLGKSSSFCLRRISLASMPLFYHGDESEIDVDQDAGGRGGELGAGRQPAGRGEGADLQREGEEAARREMVAEKVLGAEAPADDDVFGRLAGCNLLAAEADRRREEQSDRTPARGVEPQAETDVELSGRAVARREHCVEAEIEPGGETVGRKIC